jgi:hypothetical protein
MSLPLEQLFTGEKRKKRKRKKKYYWGNIHDSQKNKIWA